VRLSELSEHSGLPIATIKYYLREGLLPAGARVNARQAEYGDEHLRRLRLIRAMQQVGGMSVSQVRNVLTCAEDGSFSRHERLGITQYLLPPHVEPPAGDQHWVEVRAEVDALMVELDWQVNSWSPSLDALTRAVVALRHLGYRSGPEDLKRYAMAVRPLAEAEYLVIDEEYPDLDEAMEATVAYTLLYEPILLAVRRLAHEDVSARLHRRRPLSPLRPDPPPAPDPAEH
jgi:DNA-binding transcriptional MerR regulator